MANKNSNDFFDAGRAESQIYEPNEEVKLEFAEAQMLVSTSEQIDSSTLLSSRLPTHNHDGSANSSDGEEAIGGFSTTTDDDLVDEMGEAVGLVYEDNEPLNTTEKVEARDRHRWELDPASSEDYQRRVNHEGE
jgi:hypothetical protein